MLDLDHERSKSIATAGNIANGELRTLGFDGRVTVIVIHVARGLIELYFRPVYSTSRNAAMREVQASEAKTHLPELLNAVERGETILIRRHGKPIARIVPEQHSRNAEIRQAIEDMKALRKTMGRLSLEEILSARDEGRRG